MRRYNTKQVPAILGSVMFRLKKSSVPVFLILTVFCFQESYLYLFNLKVIELQYNKMFEFGVDFSEYCSDQTYRIAPSFLLCIVFVISFSMLCYLLKNPLFLFIF